MAKRPSLSTVSVSQRLSNAPDAADFEIRTDVPPPPVHIERYAIGKLIGKGGMGLVYHAHDKWFDREVALKVLLENRANPQLSKERFFQEACTTARLQHPGIVSVYDMGVTDAEQPYFAMKLVVGRTLSELLEQENHTLAQRTRLLDVFARVCQTIAYAHSRETVHLDLKPSNVMVGMFGEVHVMDWGLSRRLDLHSSPPPPKTLPNVQQLTNHKLSALLSNSKIIGTPSYMAPEQARGQQIGVRSDVFGLGSILCEILTGKPPYEGHNFRQVYRRAARGGLRKTYQRLDACSADPALIALAKRCLARNAADRPANAGLIASEITHFNESSMQRAERDLYRFFEISRDLFCIASLDGYFKRVNSNFSRVLGYSDHHLVSKPFIKFIHPDDVPQTIQAVETLSKGNPVAEFRNRYRDIDGNFRWFEWTARSIPEDNIIFAVARVLDPATEPVS